jgi:Mn-containing catalase
MYHHVKKLMYTVRVGEPNPTFGNMLLEQFGGANGELAAAMQYSIQGINCEDMARKDMLMDIGTEELSHLEVIGTLARMHLAPMKAKRSEAEADPLIAIAGGGGVNLYNSMGNAWTADYLKITGDLETDLRSNIAAEARAKIVYERLIQFCDDPGTRDALQFLMTREIAHMKAFSFALDSLGTPRFQVGALPPTEAFANKYFNDSTGEGEHGEIDARGPWNEGGDWEYVASEEFAQAGVLPVLEPNGDVSELRSVLADHLRELLHAERQILKALPKMLAVVDSEKLALAMERHRLETETHVARLEEALGLLDASVRAKTCRGMQGLIEEGNDVIAAADGRIPASADLSIIAAAQKVEHYEISAYITACNLAEQAQVPAVAQLLTLSLGEERAADQELGVIARALMSQLQTLAQAAE